MEQKMFLKLDGVRGESQNPRHYGEIEIFAFSWGGKHQHAAGGRGKVLTKDLTSGKKADRTSAVLWVACHSGQSFPGAVLTVEEISARGSMLRSTIIELKSIQIEPVTSGGDGESVTFNFDDLKIKRS